MVQIKSSVILRFYFYAMHSLILILLLSTSYRRYFIFSRFARFRPAKRVDDTHTYSRLHARSAKTVLTFRNIGTLDSFSFSFLLSLSLFLSFSLSLWSFAFSSVPRKNTAKLQSVVLQLTRGNGNVYVPVFSFHSN